MLLSVLLLLCCFASTRASDVSSTLLDRLQWSKHSARKSTGPGITQLIHGSLYYQPKHCTIIGEHASNHHAFALFDRPQLGNLNPTKSTPLIRTVGRWRFLQHTKYGSPFLCWSFSAVFWQQQTPIKISKKVKTFTGKGNIHPDCHLPKEKNMTVKLDHLYGCFLKWWVSPKHPKCWSFLVGKPVGLLGKPTILGNIHIISQQRG